METPSSNRRITRSQALLLAASSGHNTNVPISMKSDESDKSCSKSRQRTTAKKNQQQDRSALFDITNDSPIGGLASGTMETPSSYITKQRNTNRVKMMMTPGSGEALLRGQVKTLLQKVEEETGNFKPSFESHPLLGLRNFVNSPLSFLAPTPANTPQISDLSVAAPQTLPIIVGEQIKMISQEANELCDGKKEESPLSRSLFSDFTEKSDSSEYLTKEGGRMGENPCTDDDNASIWSLQVNASNKGEDEVDDEIEEEGDYEEEDYEELCEGMNNISIRNEEKSIMAQFIGKHTRFVYNSDDEMIEEEEAVSDGVMNGLPTPQGRHLRFTEEEEEEAEFH